MDSGWLQSVSVGSLIVTNAALRLGRKWADCARLETMDVQELSAPFLSILNSKLFQKTKSIFKNEREELRRIID